MLLRPERVGAVALAVLSVAALSPASAAAQSVQQIDLVGAAQSWNVDFDVHGSKTEPTFVEHVEYARQGDRFLLRGDVDGQDLGQQVLDLGTDGSITVSECPTGSICTDAPPNGFLSTMAVLAALRAGRLSGVGDGIAYAGRPGVCVPLEAIQPELVTSVVLDPCLDLETGALLAERRRFDGQFGGAMLDESSFHLVFDQPH